MWCLEKDFSFEACHTLVEGMDKCSRTHGHSFKCTIGLESKILQTCNSNTDMVINFNTIKEILNPIIEYYLDHHNLNETLNMDNPTCERISQWIYKKLMTTKLNTFLVFVTISETTSSRCTYFE